MNGMGYVCLNKNISSVQVYPIPLPPCLYRLCWTRGQKVELFTIKPGCHLSFQKGRMKACGCFRDEKRPGFWGIMVMEPKYLSEEVSVHPNHSLTR